MYTLCFVLQQTVHVVHHVSVLRVAKDPAVRVWLGVSVHVVTTVSVVMPVPVMKALVRSQLEHEPSH